MFKSIRSLFLLATLYSCGQSSPDLEKEQAIAVCDKIMENFQNGSIPNAIVLLKNNSVINPSSLDSLGAVIVNQFTGGVLQSYGKVNSYEFIVERKVKDFISKRFYILKFEKFYLKFDFTLYKAADGWKITGFNYNEDLIELLY